MDLDDLVFSLWLHTAFGGFFVVLQLFEVSSLLLVQMRLLPHCDVQPTMKTLEQSSESNGGSGLGSF